MSGHKKWSDIKHKRDRSSVLWTGDNVDEVEEFANNSHFGFTIGSSIGKVRRRHRLFERLSFPKEDKTVLEIFPDRKDRTKLEQFLADKSVKDLNGLLVKLEYIIPIDRVDLLDRVRELVDTIESERDREYVPWHWTDARPGDRIFGDGTVERGGSKKKRRSWRAVQSYFESQLSSLRLLSKRIRS